MRGLPERSPLREDDGPPVHVVVDTNILVDFLRGFEPAREELERYTRITVSQVTWIEVLAGTAEGTDERQVRGFLQRFIVQPVDAAIAERAVSLRRKHRIRVAEAVIWGTAQHLDVLFVTRNSRDFPLTDPAIRLAYRV
jgi:predicted nucleic acid-binding protein